MDMSDLTLLQEIKLLKQIYLAVRGIKHNVLSYCKVGFISRLSN